MERPWGISNAAPTPWMPRAAISWPRESEAAQAAEARAKRETLPREMCAVARNGPRWRLRAAATQPQRAHSLEQPTEWLPTWHGRLIAM